MQFMNLYQLRDHFSSFEDQDALEQILRNSQAELVRLGRIAEIKGKWAIAAKIWVKMEANVDEPQLKQSFRERAKFALNRNIENDLNLG